ncbi:MAG: inositol phosphorylceramide synthase [Frankia sp.]|nr:inositol phosphorylceramide synthase [Frankia sp.]
MVYRVGRTYADGRQTEALRNALDVWHFERVLRLPSEYGIQQLALHSTHLLEAANRFYIGVHFPAAILFLLWVMFFQRAHWPRVRNVIVLATGAALVIHILYPLAPPRFLPAVSPHIPFVDTGLVIGPSAYSMPGAGAANEYAAMPSLHVGWAILEAWGIITILRYRARWLAVVHPVATAIVVVITANHYWLDGLIGGGLVYAAVVVTRPRPWSAVTGVALAPVRRVRSAVQPLTDAVMAAVSQARSRLARAGEQVVPVAPAQRGPVPALAAEEARAGGGPAGQQRAGADTSVSALARAAAVSSAAMAARAHAAGQAAARRMTPPPAPGGAGRPAGESPAS